MPKIARYPGLVKMLKRMTVKYVIALLEKECKILEKRVKQDHLMQQDLREAHSTLRKVNDLKKAIKYLKHKELSKNSHTRD